jgi:hypothetical protein
MTLDEAVIRKALLDCRAETRTGASSGHSLVYKVNDNLAVKNYSETDYECPFTPWSQYTNAAWESALMNYMREQQLRVPMHHAIVRIQKKVYGIVEFIPSERITDGNAFIRMLQDDGPLLGARGISMNNVSPGENTLLHANEQRPYYVDVVDFPVHLSLVKKQFKNYEEFVRAYCSPVFRLDAPHDINSSPLRSIPVLP